jgi:predicted phage terminase large subunit-like protein
MPNLSTRKSLSTEDKKFLFLAVEELKSRGIPVPPEVAKQLEDKSKAVWPTDPNGYFVRNDGKRYAPSENQGSFVSSTARFSALWGPRGCGKSGGGAQKAMRKIMLGESGAVMNPDMENFKLSTWPELKAWLPWEMVVPSQRYRRRPEWEPTKPFTMVFMNGAKVYCKGLKNPDSARGPNINWLWYDEAGRDKTGDGWKIAVSSVRVGSNPQLWATFTPKHSEHWTTKFFVRKQIPEEVKEQFAKALGEDKILIESFHATRKDNEVNLDPGFYASVLVANPSGWLKAQEYDGEVADEGGQIGYRQWFDNKVITTLPERVEKKVRSWDTAATEKKVAKDDPDESVGSLLIKFIPLKNPEWMELYGQFILPGQEKKPHFILESQVSGYWVWERLLEVIKNTARHDGPYVEVLVDQDPGGAGKNQVAAVVQAFKAKDVPELNSHTVKEVDVKKVGDRVLAANTHWFGVAAEGRFWLLKAGWNEGFIGQVEGFTMIEHDDKVTSVTSGMFVLNPARRWSKMPFVSI